MDSNKKLVIITGLSGAGKSAALQSFEDSGYFCIDNLPPVLLSKLVEIMIDAPKTMQKVALAIDTRGMELFKALIGELDNIMAKGEVYPYLIFLDATDDALVSRFKETRRAHPLATNGVTLLNAIKEERELLTEAKIRANKVIDTSNLKAKELRHTLLDLMLESKQKPFHVQVLSFGFKHGIPIDADLMFDVRFLPNPYYEIELRPYTGLNDNVYQYVMNWQDTEVFYKKLIEMLKFMLPKYIDEGKSQLTIAIGCTGGQHRSVAISRRLGEELKDLYEFEVYTNHRDAKIEGKFDG